MKFTDLSQFPALQGTPSLATRKYRAIEKLAAEANLILQLMDRLKACTSLRQCDSWSPDHYQLDDHIRAIERGDYQRAYKLITSYGVST